MVMNDHTGRNVVTTRLSRECDKRVVATCTRQRGIQDIMPPDKMPPGQNAPFEICPVVIADVKLSLAAQCIVIGSVSGCVCVCVCGGGGVCYHDNWKLRASIFAMGL